jgi:hypothetical protein
MNGEPVKVLIDAGANDDVIDETTYQQFAEEPVLQNARISLYSYNSKEPLVVIGQFEAQIVGNGKKCISVVKVISGSAGCLLSCSTSRRLGLFQTEAFCEINALSKASKYRDIIGKFETAFTDSIGKLVGYKVKLHINESIHPKQQPYRRVPYHLAKPSLNKLTVRQSG